MMILNSVILIFVLLETANVCILYFFPDSRIGNGVAVFNGFERTKENPETHLFVQYLINWVAGTKLIFITLMVIILFTGSTVTKLFAVGSMVLTIATYFFRLHPIIKELDEKNALTPKGYSRTLKSMIIGMMLMFMLALVVGMLF